METFFKKSYQLSASIKIATDFYVDLSDSKTCSILLLTICLQSLLDFLYIGHQLIIIETVLFLFFCSYILCFFFFFFFVLLYWLEPPILQWIEPASKVSFCFSIFKKYVSKDSSLSIYMFLSILVLLFYQFKFLFPSLDINKCSILLNDFRHPLTWLYDFSFKLLM